MSELSDKESIAAFQPKLDIDGLSHIDEALFARRLETLNRISLELAAAPTQDELCKRAVEYGKRRLGFDRLSIWFIDREDPSRLKGTYGIDESGQLRDERESYRPSDIVYLYASCAESEFTPAFGSDVGLYDKDNRVVGRGDRCIAPIRHGTTVVGCICFDNLISGKPIIELQRDLIQLYSRVISQLTALKVAEEKLRQSEERYRFMTEHMADIVWQTDRRFVFTYVSPSDKTVRGFESDEVIGKSLFNFLPPEGIATLIALNQEREREDAAGIPMKATPYELQMIRKDGSLVWVEVLVNPIYDADGKLDGFLGVTRDISNRKASAG
jgi:PAS domain S-box-containing protein